MKMKRKPTTSTNPTETETERVPVAGERRRGSLSRRSRLLIAAGAGALLLGGAVFTVAAGDRHGTPSEPVAAAGPLQPPAVPAHPAVRPAKPLKPASSHAAAPASHSTPDVPPIFSPSEDSPITGEPFKPNVRYDYQDGAWRPVADDFRYTNGNRPPLGSELNERMPYADQPNAEPTPAPEPAPSTPAPVVVDQQPPSSPAYVAPSASAYRPPSTSSTSSKPSSTSSTRTSSTSSSPSVKPPKSTPTSTSTPAPVVPEPEPTPVDEGTPTSTSTPPPTSSTTSTTQPPSSTSTTTTQPQPTPVDQPAVITATVDRTEIALDGGTCDRPKTAQITADVAEPDGIASVMLGYADRSLMMTADAEHPGRYSGVLGPLFGLGAFGETGPLDWHVTVTDRAGASAVFDGPPISVIACPAADVPPVEPPPVADVPPVADEPPAVVEPPISGSSTPKAPPPRS